MRARVRVRDMVLLRAALLASETIDTCERKIARGRERERERTALT